MSFVTLISLRTKFLSFNIVATQNGLEISFCHKFNLLVVGTWDQYKNLFQSYNLQGV
jgi:hypothetical protein